MDFEQQQSRLRELIAHGKKQGFVTYAEINDHLLEDIISEAEQEQLQLDEIILMLNDIGIPVYEVPPDMETLLSSSIANNSSEEESSSENTNILSNIAAELGRTTDPVRMYMREMGTVELLTREGEIKLAKRIEEGLQAILAALTQYPENVFDILSDYARYEQQEIRLNDIISGFLDLEELSIPLELPPGKISPVEAETEDESFSEDKSTEDKNTDDDSDDIKAKISTTDDDEGFNPEIAKMAQDDGFTKGAGLADGATLERAMAINHWHSTHGGMYKQYFAKGFKAGRMDKIRHNNKQYNLNLQLMKDGSIRHGEQELDEYGDTAKGQKMLDKVHHRAADRVVSKKADTDPQYARKSQQTQDRAHDRLKDVAEGAPELLKQEMPLVRHIERELAQHGYEKGTPEYNEVFKHTISM